MNASLVVQGGDKKEFITWPVQPEGSFAARKQRVWGQGKDTARATYWFTGKAGPHGALVFREKLKIRRASYSLYYSISDSVSKLHLFEVNFYLFERC